jgi:hypothetical protein
MIVMGRFDGLWNEVAMEALLVLLLAGPGFSTAEEEAGLAGKPAGKV